MIFSAWLAGELEAGRAFFVELHAELGRVVVGVFEAERHGLFVLDFERHGTPVVFFVFADFAVRVHGEAGDAFEQFRLGFLGRCEPAAAAADLRPFAAFAFLVVAVAVEQELDAGDAGFFDRFRERDEHFGVPGRFLLLVAATATGSLQEHLVADFHQRHAVRGLFFDLRERFFGPFRDVHFAEFFFVVRVADDHQVVLPAERDRFADRRVTGVGVQALRGEAVFAEFERIRFAPAGAVVDADDHRRRRRQRGAARQREERPEGEQRRRQQKSQSSCVRTPLNRHLAAFRNCQPKSNDHNFRESTELRDRRSQVPTIPCGAPRRRLALQMAWFHPPSSTRTDARALACAVSDCSRRRRGAGGLGK